MSIERNFRFLCEAAIGLQGRERLFYRMDCISSSSVEGI